MATEHASELDTAEIAVALALATKRLTGRLRDQVGAASGQISFSQLSILSRIRRDGPLTAAALASAEHVSGQAIAQTLGPLRAAGLVTTGPHPSDGRKTLIAATPSSDALWSSLLGSRDAWLTRALETALSASERATLAEAVALLERVAAVGD
jgi:DNA-binding MarR family transcriptional regulator